MHMRYPQIAIPYPQLQPMPTQCAQWLVWKPALRETLSDEEKLTFKPKERNRCVIVDIREANMKVRNKRERERYPKNLEIAP
jgi:hypothetical protein